MLGRNQRYARVGDVIKAHIKEAAPDGTVKKGEVVNGRSDDPNRHDILTGSLADGTAADGTLLPGVQTICPPPGMRECGLQTGAYKSFGKMLEIGNG